MSLPFSNTAPGYDAELRNSVFLRAWSARDVHLRRVGSAVGVTMLQGQEEAGIASAAGIAASMGGGLLEANRAAGEVPPGGARG